MGTIEKLKKCLSDPPEKFRSAPFWGWNSTLKKEELEEQIKGFKKAGMGGFFIHSREGLETEYLSTEWLEDVKYCVDKARENDLEMWIYDEDKWPSGAAGGMVSQKNPEHYTARALTMECRGKEDVSDKNEGFLGIYVVRTEQNTITELIECQTCQEAQEICSGEREILLLRQEISAQSEWYNGSAPPDNLNPESVKTFLNLTHEQYEQAFGGSFPEEVKGFFTDEPNCCDFFSVFHEGRPWLPWTADFIKYFIEKRKYDPQEKLPYLFFDGEGAEKIRHDYWKTVAQLFQESYMKQIYEWCDERGLRTTGHILYENDLGYQTRVCGAAMPQLRYLHNPGIDLLGAQTDEYLTVKQCSSVANQYDRSMTISEAYGCTGWELDFSTQKWLGDWQFALGITRRCQHLALYSITGCRKRDYPPVFNYQNTWWKDNDKLEDYFGRLSMCLSEGKPVRKVLMIHPISGVWTKCRSDRNEDFNHLEMNMGWLDEHITSLNRKGEFYNRLAKELTAAHIDFDFGDEILLEEDGRIEDGKFIAGSCHYQVVVVPGTLNLFRNTVDLLKEFSKQGGTVIWLKPYPTLIEGEKSDIHSILDKEIFRHTAEHVWEVPELIRKCISPEFSVKTAAGAEDGEILSMLRRTEDGYILFLTNHDRNNSHEVYVHLSCGTRVEELDPMTGNYETVKTCVGRTEIVFARYFETGMSRIYFIKEGETEKTDRISFPYRHPHYTDPVLAALGPDAEFRRTMRNVLTIDRCTYKLNDSQESDEMEIWKAQKEIREKLHMQQIYYNGAPQRYTWINKDNPNDGTLFSICFKLEIQEDITGDNYFVIEKPYGLKVFFDDEKCERTEEWFVDKEMILFRLPKLIKGKHKITVSGLYDQKRELEDVFIIGDFAVDLSGKIFKEKDWLHTGDWCMQGYANYPGSIIYQYKVPRLMSDNRIQLHIGEWSGTLLKVRVNGSDVGLHMEKKNCVTEVQGYFDKEENLLELEIVGSPRNMFGPFHQAYTGCSRISWADFRTEGRFHTNGKVLKPYGIFEQSYICEYKEEQI